MTTLLETRDDSARRLMERVLRGGASIAEEYPLVFDPRFAGRLVALGEDGGPGDAKSACTILVRDFLVDGTRVRGGMIGSVVTAPEHRGRGLATRVLCEAEEALRAEGCAFALLWAEDPDFYGRRGYCPIGSELDFALPFELVRRLPAGSGVRALRSSDAPTVHALYERHRIRVCRTLAESEALLACPRMTTLVRERDGSVVAYACLGRGADFEGVIHEWGGATDDLLPLLRAHLERLAGTSATPRVYLMAPASARDLALRLESLGTPVARGFLGLGKLLDRDAAGRLLESLLGPGGRVEPSGDPSQPFRIVGPEDEGSLDDDGVLALIAGVDAVRPHVAAFLERFGLTKACRPLELFAWGLDSI